MIRRVFCVTLAITVLFLFGSCSADSSEARAVTEFVRGVSSAEIRAAITAVYPDRTAEYTLQYSYQKDGEQKLHVIKPDSIADISVTIKNGSTELTYDGTRLETGRLDESGLSPISALPSLMNAWTGGNISESARSGHDGIDCILIISRHTLGDAALEYRTWFEKGSNKPLYAEIYSDGSRIIQCEFEGTEYK